MYFVSVYYITCGIELELHRVLTLMEMIFQLTLPITYVAAISRHRPREI